MVLLESILITKLFRRKAQPFRASINPAFWISLAGISAIVFLFKTGICEAGVPQCVAAWERRAEEIQFTGLLDKEGNAYWVEGSGISTELVSANSKGTIRFRARHARLGSEMMLDGTKIVITTDGQPASLAAFDNKTGRILWSSQPELQSWSDYPKAANRISTISSIARGNSHIVAISSLGSSIDSGPFESWMVSFDGTSGRVVARTKIENGKRQEISSGSLAVDEEGNITVRTGHILEGGLKSFSPSGNLRWAIQKSPGVRPLGVGSGLVIGQAKMLTEIRMHHSLDGALLKNITGDFQQVLIANNGVFAQRCSSPVCKMSSWVRFDSMTGALIWQHPIGMNRTNGSYWTSNGQLAIASGSPILLIMATLHPADDDAESGWSGLIALDTATGKELSRCVLGKGEELLSGAVRAGSFVELSTSRNSMERYVLRGYSLPGIEAMETGWTSVRGSPDRDCRSK